MKEYCTTSSAFDNLGEYIYFRYPEAKINGTDVCVEKMKATKLWRVRAQCRFSDRALVIYADNLESKEAADVALDLLKEN